MSNESYRDIRLQKLKNWRNWRESNKSLKDIDRFDRNFKIDDASKLDEGVNNIILSGRIMFLREIGQITFLKLQDFSGSMQAVLNASDLENYKFYIENLDIGDLIGVKGEIFFTKSGEKSLKVLSLELLTKCLHPLPEKWHGIEDDEIKIRQRYLDLLVNKESKERFKFRYKFIRVLKDFLNNNDYIEVETPILQKQASGALATPFKTHHNALDLDLYLRIAPETYLKRLIAGGYERVYELGKNFRNEGIDPTHLQEFTMLEFYTSFWNYRDAIKFVISLFKHLFQELEISSIVEFENVSIDFSFDWPEITYSDLFKKYTNLDLSDLLQDEQLMKKELSKFVDVDKYFSAASLIDAVYKKKCRPELINPIIITNQPAVLGPLARQSVDNPFFSDRFQIVINGLEVVNAYSELVDPILQRKILLEQQELKNNGEAEAMESEEDFLLAMEYGMYPMAGVGIGIDRMISLLTNASSLRDVVFFPNVK